MRPFLERAGKLEQGRSHVFCTGCLFGARAFELVRRSLLQAPGLPFGDALSADQMQAAFDAEGISFADRDDDSDGLVYTPAITPWALLSQMLFTVEAAPR